MATATAPTKNRANWGDAGRAALAKRFPDLKEDTFPPSDAEIKIINALEASVTQKEHLAQLTDRILITFTRGFVTNRYKDLPVDEAIQKTLPVFHNCLRFRAKYDVVNVLSTAEDPSRNDFKREWISSVLGCDDNGRMLLLFAVISDEFMTLFPQKKQQAFILNQIRLLETLNGTKDELEKKGNGKLFYKHVLIVDMGSNGITRAKVNYLSKMLTWGAEADGANNFMQDFYPETLLNLWGVNTPLYFRAIWAFAKAFIDPITAAKFNLVAGVPLEAMQKAGIPISIIPKYLGGKGPDPRGYHYKVLVSAACTKKVTRQVQAGDTICYDLGTPAKYMDVSITFNGTEVLPKTRMFLGKFTNGTFVATVPGDFQITFDNQEYRWTNNYALHDIRVTTPSKAAAPSNVTAAVSAGAAAPPPAPAADAE